MSRLHAKKSERQFIESSSSIMSNKFPSCMSNFRELVFDLKNCKISCYCMAKPAISDHTPYNFMHGNDDPARKVSVYFNVEAIV